MALQLECTHLVLFLRECRVSTLVDLCAANPSNEYLWRANVAISTGNSDDSSVNSTEQHTIREPCVGTDRP